MFGFVKFWKKRIIKSGVCMKEKYPNCFVWAHMWTMRWWPHMWDQVLVGSTCGTKRWWAHMWDHVLVGPTRGTMRSWGPHVGPSAGGAHMWDRSGGSMLTCNAKWMCEQAPWWGPHVGPCAGGATCGVGPWASGAMRWWDRCGTRSFFPFFSSCFVTIMSLFCGVNLLSSLVLHVQNWNDSSVTNRFVVQWRSSEFRHYF
jgi:hypothetical protein